MYCKRAAWPLLLLLASCGRQAAPVSEHLAILRFENLGSDASADWMGRAFSEIIAAELSGLPNTYVIPSARMHNLGPTLGVRPVSAPGISTERTAAILAGANRIGDGEYAVRGGRIEARLSLEDPQTGRTTEVLSTSAADVVTAASDLARQLSPRATKYLTANPEAVRHYMAAMESSDAAVMTDGASAAIAADPNYAPPYRLLAEVKSQQHDRDGALAVLDQAMARGDAIPPAERARDAFESATLRNDFAARERALGDLAKASPGDLETWRALGDGAYARHDYAQALEAFKKALALQPGDTQALNEFGYSQAYTGDMEGALRTFRRYQSLRPNEANPLDSMADILLMYGRLREAEELYVQADKKDRKLLSAGDLLKAAMARLMTGDVPGANALAKQFFDARAQLHDPTVPIHQAEWLWISGDRKGAMLQLQGLAHSTESGGQKDVASLAYSDLAIWSLLLGDRAGAAQLSLKAVGLARQATAGDAIMARFLAQPAASPAEWNSRADQVFRNVQQTGIKDLTLARALLLERQFPAAAEALRRVYGDPTADPGVPILLAWCLIETGHAEEAVPLLRFNPIPPYTGIGPFAGFYFPRFYELRARLAEKAGRADEAQANRQLFEKLGK